MPAALLLVLGTASAAWGAVASPTITGSIHGVPQRGQAMTFRLQAMAPRGAQDVSQLQVALLLHSVILDEIVYDARDGTVATPASIPVQIGSTAVATGTFLQISGRGVTITTSGTRVSAILRARIAQTVPAGAEFSLAVITTSQVARVFKPVILPLAKPATRFSWGSFGLAVAMALFAGGFVGNLFSSRRRAVPSISVYSLIEQRMSEETTVAS